MKEQCKHCGAEIYFNPRTKKWVTDRTNWQCGDDPEFPVRAHAPRRLSEIRKASVYYRQGGNPPTHAGLFDHEGNRLAFWPAGYAPTEENVEAVMLGLVITREDDAPVPREAIRDLLSKKSA